MRVPRLAAIAVGLCGLAAMASTTPVPSGLVRSPVSVSTVSASTASALADVVVRPGVQHAGRVQASPPTTADCEKSYKISCTERSWRVPWEQGNRLMFAGRLAARVAQRNMICLLRLGPPGCLAYSP